MKTESVWKFYRLFHGRGMSLTKLGKLLGTTHGHLSQVISGTRGAHTRKHIARYLTREETDLLEWEEHGQFVPPGTMFPVERCCFGKALGEKVQCPEAAKWVSTFQGKRTLLFWCDAHKVSNDLSGEGHGMEALTEEERDPWSAEEARVAAESAEIFGQTNNQRKAK